MSALKIGVLGAGAIGGYIGACLALRADCQVTFIARDRLIQEVKTSGGILVSSLLDPTPVLLDGVQLRVATL